MISLDTTYRVFRFNDRGRIIAAEIIAASSDAHAIAIAQAIPSGHGVELWERMPIPGDLPTAIP